MKTPLISVVIPVYNAQKTLPRCIESILVQTYSHFEIVLVNDGSKDNSIDVCKEYEKKYSCIHVVDVVNGGVSKARNLGINNAKGDYVVFVDSDDYVYNHYLEVLLENYSDVTLPVVGYTLIESKETKNITYGDKKYVDLPMSSFFNVYEAGMMGSPCNKIYDLNFIKKEGIYFKNDFSLGEDLLFNLEYIQKKGYQHIKIDNRPILYYDHADEGTLSTSFSKEKILTLAKLYHEMIKFMKEYCFDTTQIIHMKERFLYDVLFYGEMMYIRTDDKKDFYSFIKQFIHSNEVSTLKEISIESKNIRLKIKLWCIYYLNFGCFYNIFVRGV